MKKIAYFPGCTLKTTAKNFEISAQAVMQKLDWDMVEIPSWNCCGTVYSLATDNVMNQVAPIRNILRAMELKLEDKRVVTLCSMCYNTLKRANLRVKRDKKILENLNAFMNEEVDYNGEMGVVHLLEILREIGYSTIKENVEKPLKGLKVAAYYGCLLLRPKEAAVDSVESPTVMEDVLEALGAEVIDYTWKSDCCGAYHTVKRKDVVIERTKRLVEEARDAGADMIALS